MTRILPLHELILLADNMKHEKLVANVILPKVVRAPNIFLNMQQHKANTIAMSHVTSNKPSDAKVTTAGIFVGPLAVQAGATPDSIVIVDSMAG